MVLLNLLGPSTAELIMKDLPKERKNRLSDLLRQMRETPPNRREVNDVLHEFDRLLRDVATDQLADGASLPGSHARRKSQNVALSEDPLEAITQISELRLVAALKGEAPRTVALVLNCLSDIQAANVLQQLPQEQRDGVVLQLKERLTPSLALMRHLLKAVVAKCQSFVEQELEAESVVADARVARLLRTMEPERRGEVLQFLEEADPAATERIRNALFSVSDLLRVEDKTLQKVLGEINTRALAVVLKSCDPALRQRVMDNLSKRGREALGEEIELLNNVSKAELAEAEKSMITAMIELDKVGELKMRTS